MERATLKQRDFSLNLTGRLGKSQVVTNSTPLNQQVRRSPLWTSAWGCSMPARAFAGPLLKYRTSEWAPAHRF